MSTNSKPTIADDNSDIPVAEVTKRGKINIPFTNKHTSTNAVAEKAKSTKDKVKTGLAVIGLFAVGAVAYGQVAKKKTGDDTLNVAVSLPSIDTTSSDAPAV